jgi:SAM-dependent methyltransferase
MPVALFFRTPEGFRDVDRAALALIRGRVLDVGAGVGSMALSLQDMGRDVTAVEVVPEAADIMVRRGVENVWEGRIQDLPPTGEFDTILVLMNGASLAGSLQGLPQFLSLLGGLLSPGGQVLLDSTDLVGKGDDEEWQEAEGDYPGELQYQLEFQGERGAPFPQLFVDPRTLARIAQGARWTSDVVWEGTEGEFLARLRPEP